MPMISLAELQRRIDSGDLSADAAITQSLEAIEAHDKTIGAFVCRTENVRAASAGPLRVGQVCRPGRLGVHATPRAQLRPTGGCDQLVLNL